MSSLLKMLAPDLFLPDPSLDYEINRNIRQSGIESPAGGRCSGEYRHSQRGVMRTSRC